MDEITIDGKRYKLTPIDEPAQEFKVGDRVRHKEYGHGTIKVRDHTSVPYLVEFDDHNDQLHDGGGKCLPDHGYWCYVQQLTLMDAPAQEQPAPAFKVGDRVEHQQYGRGEVMCLHENGNHWMVRFDYPHEDLHDLLNIANGKERCWWCERKNLTLIHDTRPAFLVGDEVTSVKGVVTDIDYDDIDRDVNPYRVTFGDDGYAYLRDTHLVLVTPKE
jgi:co-chaperonin GroES (HSP10)